MSLKFVYWILFRRPHFVLDIFWFFFTLIIEVYLEVVTEKLNKIQYTNFIILTVSICSPPTILLCVPFFFLSNPQVHVAIKHKNNTCKVLFVKIVIHDMATHYHYSYGHICNWILEVIKSVKLIMFIWKLTLAIIRVTKTYRSASRWT